MIRRACAAVSRWEWLFLLFVLPLTFLGVAWQTAVLLILDLCLQAIAQFKYLWQDMRYWGWCDETGGRTGADTGGLANIRTSDAELRDIRYLQQKYGRDVVTPDGKKRGSGMTVRVKIPQKYKE